MARRRRPVCTALHSLADPQRWGTEDCADAEEKNKAEQESAQNFFLDSRDYALMLPDPLVGAKIQPFVQVFLAATQTDRQTRVKSTSDLDQCSSRLKHHFNHDEAVCSLGSPSGAWMRGSGAAINGDAHARWKQGFPQVAGQREWTPIKPVREHKRPAEKRNFHAHPRGFPSPFFWTILAACLLWCQALKYA